MFEQRHGVSLDEICENPQMISHLAENEQTNAIVVYLTKPRKIDCSSIKEYLKPLIETLSNYGYK